ncbi:endolytic transglycosylase MltG [Vibrio cholerae]|uniref:Endolytic murein transglycosylase n=1 Tax=Vibrio cholerae TaxID=666 RepID=A0A5C9SUD8_VIBCL|nr:MULTISPECIES: endolytic transglycosylase MltG [Vibrio]KQA29292.1 ABC transporter substrate-binding protein [Vibrio paracholerae 877-163]MCO7018667.1 endolytic transglycosylase MltG [Vibrio paracholerae]EGR5061261.1 endolytic transglycosylase MltG [Vibrio cholerae]EKG85604.1 aminodeoxychorismate lyase family protein [Vibrio paracholerae HE-16]MBJ6974277.1 endolytic transglycosylase MltG [Vibrio cholerae]
MIKKLVLVLVALFFVLAGSYLYVVKKMDQYLAQPLMIQEAQLVTIASGTSLSRELAQLTEQAWIQDSFVAEWVRRFHPELSRIKAGTYKLEPNMTLAQALALLVSGKEHQFSITFVEGSRFQEWREILASDENITQQLTGMTEIDIAKALGLEHEKLEGLFLAETYHFTKGTSDLDILKRAHQKLDKFLQVTWEHRQEGLPILTPYEALILASIIEKETSIAEERERISGVFINRLNKRMRLQTDPTVIYGMGEDFDGNIRKKDLRAHTPYNTYVINGLPPTPIAMPGEASIYAALNPEQTEYLYFVASGEGGHNFSKTLAEHNSAVRAYLKKLRTKQ